MPNDRSLRLLLALVAGLALGSRTARSQEVVINEILASGGGLTDDAGEPVDWVEIANHGATPVDLAGWHLTDDEAIPNKWRISPAQARLLEPGGRLVVRCSGESRPEGAALHASFRLDAAGEYLALVGPDGRGIVDEIAPAFPPLGDGVSWGLAEGAETWIPSHAEVRWRVPTGPEPGWTDADFDDSSWRLGPLGIGTRGSTEAGGEAPSPAGLVAWLPLDGDLEDRGGDHHGTFAGGAAATFVEGFDGRPGGAVLFDGLDDSIELAPGPGLPLVANAAFSVSMWVRGGPQADRRVFSEGSSVDNTPIFNLGTDATGASGRLDVFVRDASGNRPHPHTLSAGAAFDGEWHHVVWIDDDGDASLWIDGGRDPTSFEYLRPSLPVDRTAIGAILRASASFWFAGAIDEVSLWSRALSPEEIAALASGASPTTAASAWSPWIETDVSAELATAGSSLLVRIPFEVEEGTTFDTLHLRVRRADGLVAWLNGTRVLSVDAPEPVDWESPATRRRTVEEAVTLETFDLSAAAELLVPGGNVLALQALAANDEERHLLLAPELVATAIGPASFRYFTTPTPGEPNGAGLLGFVGDTRFSVDRGLFAAPFEVEISTETPGAEIRYTLDGSEPTATSGEVYTAPLWIETTTVLRAAAFRDGWGPSNVDTQSYLFPSDAPRQTRPSSWPQTWSGTPASYELDPEITEDPVLGETVVDALYSLPTVSLVLPADSLFGPRGIYSNPTSSGAAWERTTSAEFLLPERDEALQVDAGVRITGNRSRDPNASPKHGFRLIFRGEHGDAKLEAALFPESRVDRFDTLAIKPNAFDSWVSVDAGQRRTAQYIRDQWVRDAQRETGHPTSHGRFVHLWLNGIYWGVYNLGERPDASFAAEHFGGEKAEWDAIKNHEELVDGSLEAYRQLDRLIATRDFSDLGAWAELRDLVDTVNMADYMIVNMYAPAEDWPGNYYMIRRRAPGEGFKFVSWDAEYALLGSVTQDRTGPHWRDADSPTKFHHAATESAEYRLLFADRLQRHLREEGALTPERAAGLWSGRAEEIATALVSESARWGSYRRSTPYRPDVEWTAETERLRREWFPRRSAVLLDQFRARGLWPATAAPESSLPSAEVTAGETARLFAIEGTLYYTLDGSDPRLEGGGVSPTALTWGLGETRDLVPEGAPVRALAPTDGSLGSAWIEPGFDDSGWRTGSGGVGYERASGYEDLIGLDLGDELDGVSPSFFARWRFDAPDAESIDRLLLRIRYDDGFIAWINGVEVASRNAPSPSAWDSAATAPHPDAEAIVHEDIDLSLDPTMLLPAGNVLAIQGMNSSASSNDLLIAPVLVASTGGDEALRIEGTTRVRARARVGADWSPALDRVWSIDPGVRVTEIQYHPASTPDDLVDAEELEYIELENVGERFVSLVGLRLAGAVEFDFAAGAVADLAPGEVVVVVESLQAFATRYDVGAVLIAGEWSGRLRDSGERVELRGPWDSIIQSFEFSDRWHPETDGGGPSLVIVDPRADRSTWHGAAGWRPSRFALGSPGFSESGGLGGLQRPSDATQDGRVDISDAIALLGRLFLGVAGPLPCGDGGSTAPGNLLLLDANSDDRADLSDAVYLLSYLFQGGPGPSLGEDCVALPECPDRCVP